MYEDTVEIVFNPDELDERTTDEKALDLWNQVFQRPAPEHLEISVRSWVARNYPEDAILNAILTSAETTYVSFDSKLQYAAGILRKQERNGDFNLNPVWVIASQDPEWPEY